MGQCRSHGVGSINKQGFIIVCFIVHAFFLIFSDCLYFDNSFSWTRPKTIYYVGEVLTVEDDYVQSEIKDLIEEGDWDTLEMKFETTHL